MRTLVPTKALIKSALTILVSLPLQMNIANAGETATPIIDPVAKQCAAINHLDLQKAGDAPARIVKTRMVVGEQMGKGIIENRNEYRYVQKYGHVEGLPTPKMETFPDHCLVEGYVTPHIKFAMRLPPPDKWNDRFMLAACNGWCGDIITEITVPPLHHGYATLTNDGGHYSRYPFDGIWAHQNNSARIDFAYRANHVTAQVGKAIVESYYGSAAKHSYITGFSKGGNAGLFAAQRYPEDFDGIFVKAPVVNYNPKNAAGFTWLAKAIYPESDDQPIMYADKLGLIRNAVISTCDPVDGLKDGIIDDPRDCSFDPGMLLCKQGQSEAKNECLNEAQVEAIRKVYAKPTTADGTVYFNYPPDIGSELDWPQAILPERSVGTPSYALEGAATGLRYMALKDNPGPDYNWREFDYVAERDRIDEMSEILDPDSPDLKAFKAKGGKMIITHGWGDGLITPNMTIDWFEKMQAFMGGRDKTGDFVKLYLIPGNTHGSGGSGPFILEGQKALVDWVENGVEPDMMILSDEPDTVPFRTRPVYPYPAKATYKGKGDPNKAENFKRLEK